MYVQEFFYNCFYLYWLSLDLKDICVDSLTFSFLFSSSFISAILGVEKEGRNGLGKKKKGRDRKKGEGTYAQPSNCIKKEKSSSTKSSVCPMFNLPFGNKKQFWLSGNLSLVYWNLEKISVKHNLFVRNTLYWKVLEWKIIEWWRIHLLLPQHHLLHRGSPVHALITGTLG